MLYKKFHYLKREKTALIFEILAPCILVFIGSFVAKVDFLSASRSCILTDSYYPPKY